MRPGKGTRNAPVALHHRATAPEKKNFFFCTDLSHFHIGAYGLGDGRRNIHFAREFCTTDPWSMPSPHDYHPPPIYDLSGLVEVVKVGLIFPH